MYLQAALQAGSRILYAASTCSLFICSGRTFVAQAQAFFSNSARGAMPKHNGYWSVSTVQYNAAVLHDSHIDSWRQRLAGKNQSSPKFLKNKQTSKLRTSLRRNTDEQSVAAPIDIDSRAIFRLLLCYDLFLAPRRRELERYRSQTTAARIAKQHNIHASLFVETKFSVCVPWNMKLL